MWHDLLTRATEDIETTIRRLARERDAAVLDLQTVLAEEQSRPAPPVDVLPEPILDALSPGQQALERALQEWQRGVREPPHPGGAESIDVYIRGAEGLAWPGADVADLGKPTPYTRNGQFQWCGAFAAFCYAALKPDIRRRRLASTYRLHAWASGQVDGQSRLVSFQQIEPGDILLMGPGSGKPWGAHVAICASSPTSGLVSTIEGNARGQGPGGDSYEGVIKQRRRLSGDKPADWRVLFAIRPLPADYEE